MQGRESCGMRVKWVGDAKEWSTYYRYSAIGEKRDQEQAGQRHQRECGGSAEHRGHAISKAYKPYKRGQEVLKGDDQSEGGRGVQRTRGGLPDESDSAEECSHRSSLAGRK